MMGFNYVNRIYCSFAIASYSRYSILYTLYSFLWAFYQVIRLYSRSWTPLQVAASVVFARRSFTASSTFSSCPATFISLLPWTRLVGRRC